MLKELHNLRLYVYGADLAQGFLGESMRPYEERLDRLRVEMATIQKEIAEDVIVQQDVDSLAAIELMLEEAWKLAEQAVIDYWEEFGFSTGKKSVVTEGCQLRIRETTSRQIVDPGAMVQAAREDGVYAKVIQELRPIVSRASFNAWVDLKAPLGVEVTRSIAASIVVLEEEPFFTEEDLMAGRKAITEYVEALNKEEKYE